MSQAFTLPQPPQSSPRRRASPPQMATTVQFTRSPVEQTVQFTRATPSPKQMTHSSTLAVEVPASTSSHSATLEVAERSRSTSRSFKRFKSPFSRSAPSSPERPAAPAPDFPAQLSDKVAALKISEQKAEATKAPKKSKSSKSSAEKKKEDRVHYHADSSNQRPMAYATNVQLEMLMGGGSQDYWLGKSRKTGDGDEEAVGTGVEVGGFKDEDGQIWWDVEEKAEWTSLLPKDGLGLPVTNDMWVDFNNDYRRSSTSSSGSSNSLMSAELMEEMDGPLFYGDGEAEQARSIYGMQKATGTVLFPIAMGGDIVSSEARAIISQANHHLSGKPTVVIADGFEDSFLSYESCNASTVRVANIVPTRDAPPMPTMEAPALPTKTLKKGGLLKGLLKKKKSSLQ